MVRWRFLVILASTCDARNAISLADSSGDFAVPIVYEKFSETLVGNVTLGIPEPLVAPQRCSEACVYLAEAEAAIELPSVVCSRAVDKKSCGTCAHEAIRPDNSSSKYYFAVDRAPELTGGFRGALPVYVCQRQTNRTLTGVAKSLGAVRFYDSPVLKLDGVLPKRKIRVRVVLNPGWLERFDLPCRNCSSVNRLVVKVPQYKEGIGRCDGFVDQYALPAGLAGDENELTQITADTASFWLLSSEHVTSQERRQFYRNTFYLCFYESSMARGGKFVGGLRYPHGNWHAAELYDYNSPARGQVEEVQEADTGDKVPYAAAAAGSGAFGSASATREHGCLWCSSSRSPRERTEWTRVKFFGCLLSLLSTV
ncbi:hypothetical protein FOZ63_029792 [Perkinsus olseni]|uniref:Uncharacterized protein n=1 Tax=Perkinsus olseni TaxID=32597 RepID=A0A7J6NL67_PEROL|nr:hypothetical protein FOZ63_029792 [Perkinsus olseni]